MTLKYLIIILLHPLILAMNVIAPTPFWKDMTVARVNTEKPRTTSA